MKKSSKIFGSLAVSAALVMGTAVPAFADTTSDTSVDTNMDAHTGAQTALTHSGTDKSKGEGTTTVNISTYTSQISVTVPLSVQFALDTNGGAGYAPTNYKIINGTVVPVEVVSAAISKGTDGKYDFGTTASTVSGGTAVGSGTIGDLYADFTPVPAADTDTTATTHLFLEKDKATQTLGWEIGAKQAGGSMTYTWNGSSYTSLDDLKAAIIPELGDSSNASFINGAADLTALNKAIDKCNTLDSTSIAHATAEGSDGSVELGFTIKASSSVLKSAEATTNDAAKVVYTVQVA